jgi:molecular chaperone GrpE
MTDPTARAAAAAAAHAETSQPQTGEREAGAPQADATEALVREAAEYKDKVLRTLAEMENLRRRTEREVADARAYAISSFARDILAVADNMDRALQALDSELREKADAAVKGLLDGVELTERELHKALEKHGVRRFEPAGQRFDPNVHQAMYEVPDPSVPSGQVVQVIQAGYMIGDRVLRPAMVAVAKGGPKPQPAAPAPDAGRSSSSDSQANDNTTN